MARDIMLLTGAHPVHRRFGETCDASFRLKGLAAKAQPAPLKALNLLRSSLSIPSGFGYVVCESCYYYPALRRRMGLLGKAKIINMSCGPLFHHLLSGRIGGMEKRMLVELLKDVDGHLVYGSYGMELLARLGQAGKKPAGVIYPFATPSSIAALSKAKPALASHSIAVIATSDPYNKGLDVLFQAMNKVRERVPDARLEIITRMDESEIMALPGFDASCMAVLRNVPSLAEVFARSSLYAQPSRCDMFPVACIEAMAAGVPCIVSDENGMKEFTAKIDAGMVVPVDSGKLAGAIIAYFGKPQKEKKSLSDKSRAAAAFFNEKDLVALFKKQLAELEKRI
jgi:glycosyltransferase involved in cell wall biosynthesis